MSERKSITLAAPIKVGDVEVSALTIDPTFRIGWLRKAPDTPVWFIGVVKGLFTGMDFDNPEKSKDVDTTALLKSIPEPSGEEVSQMIPWLLHIVEQATAQPPAVVDQLAPGDLLKILMGLLPGMIGIANFQRTSGSGVATSPGSSDGAPQP